jgi:hypothetical protein
VLGLDDDHTQRRIAQEELASRPQSSETATDDGDVDVEITSERRT